MPDREVQQVQPPPAENAGEQTRRFSDFNHAPNIVLLGSPGAGKTTLFEEAARASGGLFIRARDFLNVPPLVLSGPLFIDGLDEQRASRGDGAVVDQIVRRLFETQTAAVRISCRSIDWLGDTDLAAFRPYFDTHGGTTVLSLTRLTNAEQLEILVQINLLDPEAFLEQAKQQWPEDFLGNPQNLIQLAEVVKSGGSWPNTRKSLLEQWSAIVLSERNQAIARFPRGSFLADELKAPAGATCAVRLISDVAGISLTNNSSDPEYPTYRSLPFFDTEMSLAALSRRAFRESAKPEAMDYSHRTTAEYLAASWIAGAVRAGLPIGRVRALLGVDGRPTTELRGLHSWLPVLLPEHADVLIDADPYGVLTYGDPASLPTSARRHLLASLGHLAKTDPLFRSQNWESRSLGALSQPDLADDFRSILNDSGARFALRSAVIDAMAFGTPIPSLAPDLLKIVWDESVTFHERYGAMTALLGMGPQEREALAASAYDNRNATSADSLRIQSSIFVRFYQSPFGVTEIAELTGRILHCGERLLGSVLWSIPDRIPTADAPRLLDQMPTSPKKREESGERHNEWEVGSLFERLLLKVLDDTPADGFGPDVPAGRVLNWLAAFRDFRGHYTPHRIKELVAALKKHPALLTALADEFVDSLMIDDERWLALHHFHEATFFAVPGRAMLDATLRNFDASEDGSVRELFLYEMLFPIVWSMPQADEAFATIYDRASKSPQLTAARERSTKFDVHDLHLGLSARRMERDAEQADGREKTVKAFIENLDAIRRGSHTGWIAWAAQVYYGLFVDSEQGVEPLQRLVMLVGDEGAAAAEDGFVTTLVRDDLPTLAEIATSNAEGKHNTYWYAVLAGLDEQWKRLPDIDRMPTQALTSGLAIDAVLPVPREDGGGRFEHPWKLAALEERPNVVKDAYFALARESLKEGAQGVDGLYELLNDEKLLPWRHQVAMALLAEFPDAPEMRLEQLVKVALASAETRASIETLAANALVGPLGTGQRDLWLTSGYLVAPERFRGDFLARFEEERGLLWRIRDIAKRDALSVDQLELTIRQAGRQFRLAGYPVGGWSGDQNPWDASDFIRQLIAQISASPLPAATESLERLSSDAVLSSYADYLLHSLAAQRARRRDAEYRQPTWAQTLAALSNGAPASAPDLHALILVHLRDIAVRVASSNTDIYKQFWNEDRYGHVTTPKTEESCRDVLVELLRVPLSPLGVTVEPEGHMAHDNRADIAISANGWKVFAELKRDSHQDLWTAAVSQLEQYVSDPNASGFGVYGVFWFGRDDRPIRPAPDGSKPTTPQGLEHALAKQIPEDRRHRIAVIVINASQPAAKRRRGKRTTRKSDMPRSRPRPKNARRGSRRKNARRPG